MDVLPFETCWAVNSEIIKQVTSSWSIFIHQFSYNVIFRTSTNNASHNFKFTLFISKLTLVFAEQLLQEEWVVSLLLYLHNLTVLTCLQFLSILQIVLTVQGLRNYPNLLPANLRGSEISCCVIFMLTYGAVILTTNQPAALLGVTS